MGFRDTWRSLISMLLFSVSFSYDQWICYSEALVIFCHIDPLITLPFVIVDKALTNFFSSEMSCPHFHFMTQHSEIAVLHLQFVDDTNIIYHAGRGQVILG